MPLHLGAELVQFLRRRELVNQHVTFTIVEMNFSISVEGRSQATGSFVVPKTGAFKFFCAVPEHMPYMWGSLVVLPDSAAPQP